MEFIIRHHLAIIVFVYLSSKATLATLKCEQRAMQPLLGIELSCTISVLTRNLNFSAKPIDKIIVLKIECSQEKAISQIDSATFNQFHLLQSLTIQNCEFDQFPENAFRGLGSLQSLRVTCCKYLQNDLRLPAHVSRDLYNLSTLNLVGIGIQIIPETFWSNLFTLRNLSLSQNKIDNLRWLNHLANQSLYLTSLNVSYNPLTNLAAFSFAGFPKLSRLILDNSSINSVHKDAFFGLTHLTELSLSRNDLSVLDLVFKNLTELRILRLIDCNITTLPFRIFDDLRELAILNLARNKLNLGHSSQRPFQALNKLHTLSLAANNINILAQEAFEGLNNLTTLYMNDNFLTLINAFSFLPVFTSLEFLYLEGSNLQSLRLIQRFRNLKFVQASNNILNYVTSDHFENSRDSLETVILWHTRLQAIVETNKMGENNPIFANFSRLKTLVLCENRIERFDYFMVPDSLRTLHLGNNRITVLEDSRSFRSQKEIVNLNVNRNAFIFFDFRSFSHSLETVSCNYCTVDRIHSGTFGKLMHLKTITFLHSKISRIDRFAFSERPDKPTVTPTVHFTNYFCELTETPLVSNLQFVRFKQDGLEYVCQETTYCDNWLDIDDNNENTQQKVVISRIKPALFSTLDCGSNNASLFDFNYNKSSIVTRLFLDGNALKELPNNAFSNYSVLKFLYVNSSQIKSLEYGALSNLFELVELYLDDNEIHYLNHRHFEHVKKLSRLSLKNNHLSHLTFDVFHGFPQLKSLHLDGNFFNDFSTVFFFEPLSLENLTVTNNNMTVLETSSFYKNGHLRELHLEHNLLSELQPSFLFDTKELLVLFLNDNKLQGIQEYVFDSAFSLQELHLEQNLISSIAVDAFRDLKGLKVLHLEKNKLEKVHPVWFCEMKSLTELYLSDNQIIEVPLPAMFYVHIYNLRINANEDTLTLNCLQKLTLHNNNLSTLAVWNLPTSLSNVTLAGNDFTCNCDFLVPFRDWAIGPDGSNKITDIDHVFCKYKDGSNSSIPILQHAHKHCQISFPPLFILLITGGCFITIISVSVLVYMHRVEMQVWLYSRYGLRLFYQNNDADLGRIYHAFVSYSSDDEVFVAENLVKFLEPDFRLCVHGRDFPVGAYITDTVCEVVEKSCRTILVLSQNFVKSEWCRFEFKVAHHQTLKDRCCRLIVILMEDVDISELDLELKIYLKTNTYLKWGDRFFWEKFMYVMPDVQNLEFQEEMRPLLI